MSYLRSLIWGVPFIVAIALIAVGLYLFWRVDYSDAVPAEVSNYTVKAIDADQHKPGDNANEIPGRTLETRQPQETESTNTRQLKATASYGAVQSPTDASPLPPKSPEVVTDTRAEKETGRSEHLNLVAIGLVALATGVSLLTSLIAGRLGQVRKADLDALQGEVLYMRDHYLTQNEATKYATYEHFRALQKTVEWRNLASAGSGETAQSRPADRVPLNASRPERSELKSYKTSDRVGPRGQDRDTSTAYQVEDAPSNISNQSPRTSASHVPQSTTILYAHLPEPDGTFKVSELKQEPGWDALYSLRLVASDSATVSMLNNPDRFQAALQSPQQYLSPACEYEIRPPSAATRINVLKPGRAILEGQRWKVHEKMKIEFV